MKIISNLTKLGLTSFLIGVSLLLSACGSDSTSKVEAFVKEKFPDAQILTFDEAKKELGLTNKECLFEKNDASVSFTTYSIIKTADGELKILRIMTDKKNGASLISRTYSANEMIDNFKSFKSNKADCFK